MSKSKRVTIKRHKKPKARFSTVIYTLFGAYVLPRRGEVNATNLIKLIRPLGFSANAIRLGLSRMSRYGVFRIRKVGRHSYYSLSIKGMKWMEQGRVRAFDMESKKWDGKWRLVVYNIPEQYRAFRDRLRSRLHNQGFASLSTSLWISPYDFRSELERFIRDKKMSTYVETFEARYTGQRRQKELAKIAWDVDALTKRYQSFIDEYSTLPARCERTAQEGGAMSSADCFAQRFCMTAEYVALKLEDPMLPLELLPKNWVGARAERLHDQLWKLLRPSADEFVDSVLQE
jgi:phenylacetic acid degradation operon negative regulatory protein